MRQSMQHIAKRKVQTWNLLTGQNVTASQWLDWKWQFRNRITDESTLGRLLGLDQQTQEELVRVGEIFLTSVTPFQLVLVYDLLASQRESDAKALAKVFLPNIAEISAVPGGIIDGLGEEGSTPYSYISQLYPDRVLLFVTDICPLYCRYCFRRRKVIHQKPITMRPENILQGDHLEQAAQYIESHTSIRDVILSGGEPLILDDEHLEKIIRRLRKINHVDIIRIDTKIPTVMPQRITDDLVSMLHRYHPIFMTLHFVHPAEIDDEVRIACAKLVNAGIPLGTYTPILRGINNDRQTLKTLFWELVKMRIRPYYLVHFVPTIWTEHFRVSLQESLELISGLHYELSGIALPAFKVYVPGCGKIPIVPQRIEGPFIKGSKRVYKFLVPMLGAREKEIYYEEPLGGE